MEYNNVQLVVERLPAFKVPALPSLVTFLAGVFWAGFAAIAIALARFRKGHEGIGCAMSRRVAQTNFNMLPNSHSVHCFIPVGPVNLRPVHWSGLLGMRQSPVGVEVHRSLSTRHRNRLGSRFHILLELHRCFCLFGLNFGSIGRGETSQATIVPTCKPTEAAARSMPGTVVDCGLLVKVSPLHRDATHATPTPKGFGWWRPIETFSNAARTRRPGRGRGMDHHWYLSRELLPTGKAAKLGSILDRHPGL
ncbi:hypothetical protein ZHAS_00016962 [Anopheles sinensis]|uniref:Uncharacterized protein n=1 Tax=Anopheles sinensis TaxID=74873 RepID=A0A084WFG7_ANOSI|nr:hypothetical protein ZHAS_00016962 [Anopheles sinensis]